MKIDYHSLTDKGVTRELNEDCYLNDDRFSLFMVADGMGGYERGDVASQLALSSIREHVISSFQKSKKMYQKSVFDAIQHANERVHAIKENFPDVDNIGTTVICLIIDNRGRWMTFHVGDTRAYRFRNGELIRLTKDHSVEEDLPDFMKGLGGGKYSSMVTRAVGVDKTVEVDMVCETTLDTDLFLLCTDGLYSMVEEETIKAVLEEESGLREKAEKLVALANENGGEDNITVTLVRIEPGTADDTPARESRNILVVEDDQILRDSIHSLLETTSYTVDSVEDGEKALKMLQKNRYTAIILDNYLPFIHGAELLGLIRATDPDVKIIVMSGFLNPEIIDSVKHNKADLILEKPLDFEALGNFLKTIE